MRFIALKEITTKLAAEAIITIWITRFRVTFHIVTDKGSQLERYLFLELSIIAVFQRLRTTAYHPLCSGLTEERWRTIKTAIIVYKETWLSE